MSESLAPQKAKPHVQQGQSHEEHNSYHPVDLPPRDGFVVTVLSQLFVENNGLIRPCELLLPRHLSRLRFVSSRARPKKKPCYRAGSHPSVKTSSLPRVVRVPSFDNPLRETLFRDLVNEHTQTVSVKTVCTTTLIIDLTFF